MRWEDERYVRIFTRDTPSWDAMGWEAQALLVAIFRKMDRTGLLELGSSGMRGLAACVRMPIEVVERALKVLLEDGVLAMSGPNIFCKNFMAAQECAKSDSLRSKEKRERAHLRLTQTVSRPTQTVAETPRSDTTAPRHDTPSVPSVPCLPDLTPPKAASVSVPISLPLLASGSGSEQPACQTEPKDAEKIRAVFDHYRSLHPRSFPVPVSTSKEWRQIQARLREGHTVEDLCRAIDGYHRSPFHLGENDRGRQYLGLDLLMRDGTHVEEGIRLCGEPDKPVMSVREMRSKRAGAGFLERLESLGMGGKANGSG